MAPNLQPEQDNSVFPERFINSRKLVHLLFLISLVYYFGNVTHHILNGSKVLTHTSGLYFYNLKEDEGVIELWRFIPYMGISPTGAAVIPALPSEIETNDPRVEALRIYLEDDSR